MGHERLTSLALISIERDQLQLDSLDSIVDKFKHSSNQTRTPHLALTFHIKLF